MNRTWILFVAATAFAQTATNDQTGSVTGTVTDAITRMPVKKTIVSINPTQFVGPQSPTPGSATTDGSGAFTVSNLQPGHYRLQFIQQSYPQARFGGTSKSVEVKAGETSTVNVELMPGAAVSGRIVDEDGDPLANCHVQLHPMKNPEQGVPMTGLSMSTEGEYRAFGIAPGKYILSAQCPQPAFHARPFSAGPDPPAATAYPMQYYPLTTDPKSAQVVELTGGSEKSGIDFKMNPVAVTQIHGAFSPGSADWHANRMNVALTSPDGRVNMGAGVDQTKGTFEFRQVFPGSYILTASTQGTDENRVGAWQKIDVTNQPLDIVLELRRAAEVSGKLQIENNNSNKTVTANQFQIMLTPADQFGMQPPQPTQANEDGTFTLKGVLPGMWRLQVNGPWSFLKSAWLGSTDVTSTAADFSTGAGQGLRVMASTNTATIKGSAPSGQTIIAQHIDDYLRFRGNQGTQADQTGQYKFEGLAPGKYRLMLMDYGAPMPDEGGQEITVQEGETATLDLKPQSNP